MAFTVQAIKKKQYYQSSTHYRVVAQDHCSGLNKLITDTNGLGVYTGTQKTACPFALRPQLWVDLGMHAQCL